MEHNQQCPNTLLTVAVYNLNRGDEWMLKCLDLSVLSFSLPAPALQLLAVSEERRRMGVRRSRSLCHYGKCERRPVFTHACVGTTAQLHVCGKSALPMYMKNRK